MNFLKLENNDFSQFVDFISRNARNLYMTFFGNFLDSKSKQYFFLLFDGFY